MARERAAASFATLTEEGQAQAMARFAVLRSHLEDGLPLAGAADAAGVPLRTAQRWLARYRRDGLAGLARRGRSDAGARRSPDDLVTLIEGMGLKRPDCQPPPFTVGPVTSPRRRDGARLPAARSTPSSRAWTRRW